LLGSVVADPISKLLEPRVNRAHIAAKIVHQDLRRVRPTIHELGHVGLILVLAHVIIFAH
jgi:hypothetical protein